MASSQTELEYRPCLRQIKFGPPQKFGDKPSYFLKDLYTAQYFRIGEREHFLLSRMDGTQTLSDLGVAYAKRFGKRMGPESWAKIFGLVRERSLFDDADTAELDRIREDVKVRSRASPGPLTKRLPLVDPEAFLDRILPWVKGLFTLRFLLLGIAAVVIAEILILPQMGSVLSAAWEARKGANPVIWPFLYLFIFGVTVFHETAHGLTLRHFGGAVPEMGVIFRYGGFFPYTRIDDVVLLPRRYQQVAVAFAGTFVSLMAIVPLVAIWIIGSPEGSLRTLIALLLTSYHLAALTNLIPFIQLDGYHMMALMMGRPLLRIDARKYAWQRILEVLRLRPKNESALSRKERAVLLVYAVLSTLVTIAFLSFIAQWWHRWFAPWLGEIPGWVAVVCLLALLLFGRKGYRWIREKARRWTQDGESEAGASAVTSGGAE